MVSIDEINSYAATIADPRLISLLAEVCKRIEGLETWNKSIDAQNKSLKELIVKQAGEIQSLKGRVLELELQNDELIAKINEHAENINTVWKLTKTPPAPKGQKTLQRLEKLDQTLKERGPRTIGQLKEDLKISSSEMTRLIAKLDNRKYKISARPGDEREKVIRLRAQIN